MKYEKTDLGLSYEEAAHGVQSSIAFEMETGQNNASEPKHLRVGIDLQKAEMWGLIELLISKGILTEEEYAEQMRIAVNTELAYREKMYGFSFR